MTCRDGKGPLCRTHAQKSVVFGWVCCVMLFLRRPQSRTGSFSQSPFSISCNISNPLCNTSVRQTDTVKPPLVPAALLWKRGPCFTNSASEPGFSTNTRELSCTNQLLSELDPTAAACWALEQPWREFIYLTTLVLTSSPVYQHVSSCNNSSDQTSLYRLSVPDVSWQTNNQKGSQSPICLIF